MPNLRLASSRVEEGPTAVIRIILPDDLYGTKITLADEWGHVQNGIAGSKPEYGHAATEFLGNPACGTYTVTVPDLGYIGHIPAPKYTAALTVTLEHTSPSTEPDPEPEWDPRLQTVVAKLDHIISLLEQMQT